MVELSPKELARARKNNLLPKNMLVSVQKPKLPTKA